MDPRNFLLNTDYPLDKVIFLASGTLTVAAGGYGTVNIPHPFTFSPLPKGSYSTSSSWDVVYEENSGPIAPTNTYSPILYGFTVGADKSNVTVSLTNYISSSSVTIYYRIYCFEPSNSSSLIAHTSSSGSEFTLNTDYNYTKLIDSDYYNFPDTYTGIASKVVQHDQGVIPQVLFWVERNNIVSQITQSFYQSGITAQPTATQVIFTSQGSQAGRVHWRIYADE